MDGMDQLDEAAVVEELSKLSEWKRDGKFIHRRYRFATFLAAIEFVNQVARIAEERNHHPFISIDYKMVTLRLTSWHAGGLTHLDFGEARQFDELFMGQDCDRP